MSRLNFGANYVTVKYFRSLIEADVKHSLKVGNFVMIKSGILRINGRRVVPPYLLILYPRFTAAQKKNGKLKK
jgi:hypothetical protein